MLRSYWSWHVQWFSFVSYLSSNISGLQSLEIGVIHRVTLERFGVAQVGVEVEVGQIVLEQVAKGHREIIVAEKCWFWIFTTGFICKIQVR